MFPGDSGTALEGGCLRSGRRFRSGKIRRIVTRRGSWSTTIGEDYELMSQFDGGSCDEEEEYQPILKGKKVKKKPHIQNMNTTHLQIRVRLQR